MRRSGAVAAILALAVLQLPGGCKREVPAERAQRPAPAAGPSEPEGIPATPDAAGAPAVMAERPVVDEEVRRHWRAVELIVREKKVGGTARPLEVQLDGEVTLPESGLVIRVLGFVPDFAMGTDRITTKSMQDVNPAVKLQVVDDGREIFKGWAFRDYPEMHSFEDPRYAIVLSRAVAAGK